MKPNRLLFLASLTVAARVCAQTVIDNGPELIVTGQFDSGGPPDIAVVDKQTGQVRTGLDGGNALTWSGPLLSGLADVAGATSGKLGLPLNEGLLLVSRGGNNLARVSPLDGSSPPVIYPATAPSAAVALDFAGTSPTSNSNGLWLSTSIFEPAASPESINLVTPSSTVLSASSGSQGTNFRLSQGQRVRFTSAGNVMAAYAVPDAGRVYVFQSVATGIPATPWRPQLVADYSGVPVGVQFTHEYLLPGGQSMFLFIAPLNANVYYAPGAAGNSSVSTFVPTGIAISFIIPVNTPAAQGFIAFPYDDAPAKFFVWNGSGFTLRQSISPPAGKRWTGALPGTNLKLLHGPATGGGTSGWEYWPLQGSGQFAFGGLSGNLPPRTVASAAHVFAFTHEPFVSPFAAMTDARRVADWTSGPLPLPGTRVMNVTRETYASVTAGLGTPAAFNAGTAPAGSAWMLTNQYAADTSISALSSAKITIAVPTVEIAPPPQHRQLAALPANLSETVTFSVSAGATVFYRMTAGAAFTAYNAASPPVIPVTSLPQTCTVEYFAQAGGISSRLMLATYSYGSSAALTVPAAADLDSDGLADSWENYYAQTNPNADPDGDGMNNLTEQNTGSDPLGACQPGELPELTLAAAGGSISLNFTRPLVPGEVFERSANLSAWQSVALPANSTQYTAPAGAVRQYFRVRR